MSITADGKTRDTHKQKHTQNKEQNRSTKIIKTT